VLLQHEERDEEGDDHPDHQPWVYVDEWVRGKHRSDENVGEKATDEAVEHDGLRQREAQPLDALKLTTELRLTGDGLDHRAEDVADANTGAERAEADTEGESDRLSGLGDIARSSGENEMHWFFLLVFRLDRRADVDGGQSSE